MAVENYKHKREIDISELVTYEKRMSSLFPINGSSARVIRKLMDLEEIPQEGSVVHLGSGFSSFVPELLSARVDAFGVDPRYDNLFIPMIEFRLGKSKNNYDPKQYQIAREVFSKFKSSKIAHQNRYKANYLLKLRLPVSGASRVVSVNFLSEYAQDFKIFEFSVREALRITMPGGRIVIAPFHTEGGTHNKYAESHARLVEILTGEGLVTVNILEPFQGYDDSRLIINKV